MAAVLGDLLQIEDIQQYLGQRVLNVYHYRVTSLTGFTFDGYDSVLDWFYDNVLTAVVGIQVVGTNHDAIVVKNLSNGVDFVERPLDPIAGGERTGQAMPPYAAWSFRLIRESLATRNGSKRYGGTSESDQENGVAVPGIQPALDAVAAVLSEDIVVGLATLAEPVIVRRPIVVPAGTSYVYSSVGDADYRGLSTQNTRKFGHGI